jgi:hypothetical protein
MDARLGALEDGQDGWSYWGLWRTDKVIGATGGSEGRTRWLELLGAQEDGQGDWSYWGL